MPYTFPMRYRKSAVASKYDMVEVAFPSGLKLFGTCKHGINGAYCRPCQMPRTIAWIDREKLTNLPSCAWCQEPIIHFDPSPVNELWLDQNRFWQSAGPDLTHQGDRGVWYVTQDTGSGWSPLHYMCLMEGSPAFQVTDNETTQHSHHDVAKEADRNYYPELIDYFGRPEFDGLTPDDEQIELMLADQKEQDRYNNLCSDIKLSAMPDKVKCGNCKNLHPSKYAVMACYKKGKMQ